MGYPYIEYLTYMFKCRMLIRRAISWNCTLYEMRALLEEVIYEYGSLEATPIV